MRAQTGKVFASFIASGRVVGLGQRSFEWPDAGWSGGLILGGVSFVLALAANWVAVWPGPATFQPMGAVWWALSEAAGVATVMLLCRIGRHQVMASALNLASGSLVWLQMLMLVVVATLVLFVDSASATSISVVLGLSAFAVFSLFNLIWAWRLGRFSFRRFPMLGSLLMFSVVVATTALVPIQGMFAKPGETESAVSLYRMAEQYMAVWSRVMSDQSSDEPAEARPRRSTLDLERTLFQQFDKVRSAVAAIESPPDDAPAYFFVGAAGFAPQAVFRREVTSARDIVDAKLSTRGRSLLMVNDRSEADSHPLATVATLDAALTGIGRKMRLDRDVLMLYLTSHGSPGVFSITAPGLVTGDLTPTDLRQMLDRSGIRNRIVVVSACYSGSFIEALEDPNTLIMTAARSDRTSFGCSDENDWTYFGDAFFNHALRETTDPIEAFAKAKAHILQWEAEKGLTHSEPQIVVGEAIGTTLSAMNREASIRSISNRHLVNVQQQ